MMNQNKRLSFFVTHNFKIMCVLIIFVFLFSNPGFSAITVTAPAAKDSVKACADYADEVMRDRWDMNERTDLAWKNLNSVEGPISNLSNISFQNGIFSATSSGSDVNINIIEPAYIGSATLGKVGKNFPINADKYTTLAIRMYLDPISDSSIGQLFWSKNMDYINMSGAGNFWVYNGWHIYMIDIPSLALFLGTKGWDGITDSLRMDPLLWKNKSIKIDWIKLVEDDPICTREITWTGNRTNVDIYLDNDNNAANGNLGMLAKNVSGTSYLFQTGALFPGNYYVAVAPTGTTNYDYSGGYYAVNDTPILNFFFRSLGYEQRSRCRAYRKPEKQYFYDHRL